MCLGMPALVRSVNGRIALVDFGDGVLREVDAGAVDRVEPGDVVVVHAGVIIERLGGRDIEELVRGVKEFVEELEKRAEELLMLYGGGG